MNLFSCFPCFGLFSDKNKSMSYPEIGDSSGMYEMEISNNYDFYCSNKSVAKLQTSPSIIPKHQQSLQQNFSLPSNIIYYITKNPSNPEGWNKLIKTCKYFFSKSPIVVIDEIKILERWCILTQNYLTLEKNDFSKILPKLWIKNYLFFNQINVSRLLPKIFQCNAQRVVIANQNLSFEEFKFFAKSATEIGLIRNAVKYIDGNVVPLEKLIGCVSLNVTEFTFHCCNRNIQSLLSCNVANLIQTCKMLKNIKEFEITQVPDHFDFQTFLDYCNESPYQKAFYISTEKHRVLTMA